MEALVSQDKNVNTINNNNEQISLYSFIQKNSSADFVIDCYKARQANNNNNNNNNTVQPDDIRILRVLSVLACTLSKEHNNYMIKEVVIIIVLVVSLF